MAIYPPFPPSTLPPPRLPAQAEARKDRRRAGRRGVGRVERGGLYSQGRALPKYLETRICFKMRMPGVEPGSQVWEACMMPLHYMRHGIFHTFFSCSNFIQVKLQPVVTHHPPGTDPSNHPATAPRSTNRLSLTDPIRRDIWAPLSRPPRAGRLRGRQRVAGRCLNRTLNLK